MAGDEITKIESDQCKLEEETKAKKAASSQGSATCEALISNQVSCGQEANSAGVDCDDARITDDEFNELDTDNDMDNVEPAEDDEADSELHSNRANVECVEKNPSANKSAEHNNTIGDSVQRP